MGVYDRKLIRLKRFGESVARRGGAGANRALKPIAPQLLRAALCPGGSVGETQLGKEASIAWAFCVF